MYQTRFWSSKCISMPLRPGLCFVLDPTGGALSTPRQLDQRRAGLRPEGSSRPSQEKSGYGPVFYQKWKSERTNRQSYNYACQTADSIIRPILVHCLAFLVRFSLFYALRISPTRVQGTIFTCLFTNLLLSRVIRVEAVTVSCSSRCCGLTATADATFSRHRAKVPNDSIRTFLRQLDKPAHIPQSMKFSLTFTLLASGIILTRTVYVIAFCDEQCAAFLPTTQC